MFLHDQKVTIHIIYGLVNCPFCRENAETESCSERLNFVCALPAMCHQDACQLSCASNNDKQFCKAASEDTPPKCYPTCTTVDCSEEVQKSKILIL